MTCDEQPEMGQLVIMIQVGQYKTDMLINLIMAH